MNNLEELFAHLALTCIAITVVESFRKRKPQLKSDISDSINKAWTGCFKNLFTGLFIRKVDINFYRHKLTMEIETVDGIRTIKSCRYTNIESTSMRPMYYRHRAKATIYPDTPDSNDDTMLVANVSGLTNFFVKNNPSNIIDAITPPIQDGLKHICQLRNLQAAQNA